MNCHLCDVLTPRQLRSVTPCPQIVYKMERLQDKANTSGRASFLHVMEHKVADMCPMVALAMYTRLR